MREIRVLSVELDPGSGLFDDGPLRVATDGLRRLIMRIMRRTGLLALVSFLFLSLALAPGAQAQKGPLLALFDIDDHGSGLSTPVLGNLLDYLSAKLAKAGYRVIPRDQVRRRLFDAKKESYRDCYDQSCQIELGRELAAQKTLALKVLQIGRACQVTAELYDLRQAATDLATTAEARCGDEQSMLEAFGRVAEDLGRPLQGSRQRVEAGLAELERLLRSDAGTGAGRAEEAWKVVEAIAGDTMASKEDRLALLRRYLDGFSEAAPANRKKASRLIVEIDLATLEIMSSPPGAEVCLNGRPGGIAPLTRELMAGRYSLRGELADHRAVEQEVELAPGEKKSVSLVLEKIPPGTLVVKAEPAGAWVTVDGKTVGQAPVARDLRPGAHRVEVRLAGYRLADREVLIKADEQESWELRLEATPGRPQMLWGHVAFWAGVGMAAMGGAGLGKGMSLQDDYNTGNTGVRGEIEDWTGVMWAGFGAGAALMITGIVLWVIAPDERTWAEQNNGYLGGASVVRGQALVSGWRW